VHDAKITVSVVGHALELAGDGISDAAVRKSRKARKTSVIVDIYKRAIVWEEEGNPKERLAGKGAMDWPRLWLREEGVWDDAGTRVGDGPDTALTLAAVASECRAGKFAELLGIAGRREAVSGWNEHKALASYHGSRKRNKQGVAEAEAMATSTRVPACCAAGSYMPLQADGDGTEIEEARRGKGELGRVRRFVDGVVGKRLTLLRRLRWVPLPCMRESVVLWSWIVLNVPRGA
jgi:hypothetical protein